MARTLTMRRLFSAAMALGLAAGISAGVAAAGGDAAAKAVNKIELKLSAQAGERFDFDSNGSTETRSTVMPAGQAPRRTSQASTERRKGTVEVLEVKDGAPTAFRVHFDADCSTSVDSDGRKNDVPFPLADKTVTVRRDDEGKVTTDAGELDPQTMGELTRMATPDRTLFPKGSVGQGDQWEGDSAALAKQLGLPSGEGVSLKCTLLKVGSVGDRITADIGVAASIKQSQGGVTTAIDLGGVAQVDLVTGQTLQADILGKLSVDGQANVPGQNGQSVAVTIHGGGKLETHQTVHLTSSGGTAGGGGAVAGGETPAPPPPTGGDAVAARGDAGAARGDAGKFSGVFRNEKLTVELRPGDRGQLSGTITLGDQKLPATAAVQGGVLAGAFESDGSKFDFTASVEGNTMQFSTGSSKYVLKKKVNPLDQPGPPPARNPLDTH